jgi:hypothetical protein
MNANFDSDTDFDFNSGIGYMLYVKSWILGFGFWVNF